ncbi:MAG: AbrB/MazE/SpoVT family DNA-binding domain-containing protein [Patescibacteria group bacterium]
MPKVTVSSKGWIVIPANLRKKYNIKPGTSLEIEDEGSFLLIKANIRSKIDDLYGVLNRPEYKNS